MDLSQRQRLGLVITMVTVYCLTVMEDWLDTQFVHAASMQAVFRTVI